MNFGPEMWIYAPWILWAVSWTIAAVWANRTVKRPGAAYEVPYRVLTLSGFALLLVVYVKGGRIVGSSAPFLQHYWTLPPAAAWSMVGVAALGFLFCWWARLHLGRLWSGSITRKEGHRVIDTGPYALVRHPIYTGLLTAALATMILRGTSYAIAGFVLLTLGYYLKARIEERFLRAELGRETYDAYARRVPMLVPFSPI